MFLDGRHKIEEEPLSLGDEDLSRRSAEKIGRGRFCGVCGARNRGGET